MEMMALTFKFNKYQNSKKMAKILITGSADGLGELAAKSLVEKGHRVVLHARNNKRGEDAMRKVPGAEKVLTGDLANMDEVIQLAKMVNESGPFDAIIQNAAVYRDSGDLIFKINTMAPYILTCLIDKPKRIVYMSSGSHFSGDPNPDVLDNGSISYGDSKLHMVMLAKAVARKWSGVYSNAVDPGWVPTKMGGSGAPGNLQKGYETQAWLAVADDAKISGRYFYHKKEARYRKETDDTNRQDRFLEKCEELTGVKFPVG